MCSVYRSSVPVSPSVCPGGNDNRHTPFAFLLVMGEPGQYDALVGQKRAGNARIGCLQRGCEIGQARTESVSLGCAQAFRPAFWPFRCNVLPIAVAVVVDPTVDEREASVGGYLGDLSGTGYFTGGSGRGTSEIGVHTYGRPADSNISNIITASNRHTHSYAYTYYLTHSHAYYHTHQ